MLRSIKSKSKQSVLSIPVRNASKSTTKIPSKQSQEKKRTEKTVRSLIKQTNKNNPKPSEIAQNSVKNAPATTQNSFSVKKSLIPTHKLHPQPATQQNSLDPAAPLDSASNSVPTAHHTAQTRTTAQLKAMQDPVLMNHGMQLVLNNGDKPYFKYGLFRTIQLPPTHQDIQQSISKRVAQLQEAKGFNNPKDRVRDHCQRRLQTGVQIFLSKIDATMNKIPHLLTLVHPFEFEIASLTLAQHAYDNPIDESILKPFDEVDLVKQYVLLHEQQIDHGRDSTNSALNAPRKVYDGFTPLRQGGALYYSTLLYNINKCREHIVHHYHKYKKLINAAELPQDMHAVSKEEMAALQNLVESQFMSHSLSLFRNMLYTLKTQHWIDPNVPTLLCIGAPNVGKSSIVRAISTSKTQVQHYRFTTRRLTLGHIEIDGFPCQVTDSPGLLPRPDHERNAMEALTLAAIRHLPLSGVIFVIDPSVQGGVSLKHQLLLRNELRWRYGELIGNKWMDVATKSDLWKGSYGVRKHTLPLTDVKLHSMDDISRGLHHEYHSTELSKQDNAGTSFNGVHEGQPKARIYGKHGGITPQWNISDALTDLGEIPAGFNDIQLPNFHISTIHLRDVHHELTNISLRDRFLKSKKARVKEQIEKEKQQNDRAMNAARGNSIRSEVFTIGENDSVDMNDVDGSFTKLNLDQYEEWWDGLSKSQQNIFMQATNDTDMLSAAAKALLGSLVTRVENQQFVAQLQDVRDQTQLESMDPIRRSQF